MKIFGFYRKIWICLLAGLFILGWNSCENGPKKDNFIIVRLAENPDNLNPLFSKSASGQQIIQHLYLSLGRFDLKTLNLMPVLAENLPIKSQSDLDAHRDCFKWTLRIRENAKWQDGKSIDVEDILYTFKTIANPILVGINSKSTLANLRLVAKSESDSRTLAFYIDSIDILSPISICDVPILPRHIYDPDGEMNEISFEDILKLSPTDTSSTVLKKLSKIADIWKSPAGIKGKSIGSGPYALKKWEPNNFLEIEKIDNWWGDDNVYPAITPMIRYQVIQDERTAIAALNSDGIDVLSELPSLAFVQAKQDPKITSKYDFYNPEILQYFYISLNNANPILGDANTRNALARMVPIDAIIKNSFAGMAKKIVGPIHPIRPYYNTDLKPLDFDSLGAREYLQKAGWTDSDKDGILDKMVGKKRIPFVLRFLTTQKALGKDIALIFQQYTAKFGIKVDIQALDAPALIKEVKSGNYDCAALATKLYPGVEDLYGSWFSYSANHDRTNYARIEDPVLDQLILATKETTDTERLAKIFFDFQAQVYKQQPIIFLCAPLEKLIVSKKWKPAISAIRPGYFENAFEHL